MRGPSYTVRIAVRLKEVALLISQYDVNRSGYKWWNPPPQMIMYSPLAVIIHQCNEPLSTIASLNEQTLNFKYA